MPHPIVEDELAQLETVRERLKAMPAVRTASEEPIVRELETLRAQLVSGSENKDRMALTAEWQRQSALLEQIRAGKPTGEVDPHSPYFAHLRLREGGNDRDLFLGRATCVQKGVRIVDWRNAPVTRIFYRYQQGDEYEEEFAGRTREGEVVARRMVRIRDGRLERIDAPEGVFQGDPAHPERWEACARSAPRLAGGEAAALRAWDDAHAGARALGTDAQGRVQRADKRLPEITGLIDPEQFELITRKDAGFLVIRGTAGSGKTTVALHRIAYLAYDDPSIDSERTLFVVFSRALRSYVSGVLPSLGIADARVVTYGEWAHEQCRRHFPRLPTARRGDTPAIATRIKLHPEIGRVLDAHVRSIPGEPSPRQALDDWASALTNERRLREVLEREAPGDVSADELQRFVDLQRKRNEEVFAYLGGDRDVEAELDPEDDALLLRAWQLRVGPLRAAGAQGDPRPVRYRHVAIDEVQDFAPVEVQVLLECLDERKSITLAGDTQQHVMQASGFTSWADFFRHLDVPGTSIETLRTSYRSSHEIASFALEVLGDLREDDEPPRTTRSGPPVELFRFTDRGASVAFLADALQQLARAEPLASVALLTPSPRLSQTYAEALSRCDLPRLHLVTDQDFSFEPGVEISEVAQVKGLEFDYVVVLDASADHYPDTPASRRLLHVAATRAVHQLWLTSIGTPSPLVGAATLI
ncbi:MAG: ATP-binding domain-containing protein [Myxococcales bacterium]|nr:ATP-binding domain-containing protein [Myxococcales bacterium]